MPYTNFDVELQRVGNGTYRVLVLSPNNYRGRSSTVTLDLASIRALNNRIETYETDSTVADALVTEGRRLYQQLFSGDLGTAFAACKMAHTDLRLRISFMDRSELWQVPWEMLCSPDSNQPLALSTSTSVVRWLSVPPQPPPAPVNQGPLRLLVIASSVGGDAFDEGAEVANLKRAVQPLIDAGKLVLEEMRTPTFADFIEWWQQAAIQGTPYHLLHITGHGIYRNDSGVLVFSDGKRGQEYISTDRLAPLLSNDPPHLIFLNLCEGATAGDKGAFSGVAQNLIRHRVPCVVGMQFSITNSAAETFSKRFYQVLAWGGDVENAVIRGREALVAAGNRVEWVTPILLLQDESLRIMTNVVQPQPIQVQPPKYVRQQLTVQQMGELADFALACPSVANNLNGVLANVPWRAAVADAPTLRAKVMNVFQAAEDHQNGWQQLDEAIALFDQGTISYTRFHLKLGALDILIEYGRRNEDNRRDDLDRRWEQKKNQMPPQPPKKVHSYDLNRVIEILTNRPSWDTANYRKNFIILSLPEDESAKRLVNSIDFSGSSMDSARNAVLKIYDAGKYYFTSFLFALRDDCTHYEDIQFLSDLLQRLQD